MRISVFSFTFKSEELHFAFFLRPLYEAQSIN